MRQILAAIVFLTSAIPSDAGGCRVVKHVAAVEAAIPVVAVTPIVISIPTYSYSYQPAAYQAPVYQPPQQVYQAPIQANVAPPAQVAVAAPEVCDCLTLLNEIRTLRSEIRGLSAGGNTSPVQTGGEAIVKTTCAQCHSVGVAEAKGGGFVLVGADGKLTQLTLQEKRRIQSRVAKDQMPPPQSNVQWSPAHKAAVLEMVK